MVTMAQIVTAHGSGYLQEFGDNMLPSHKRALADIAGCRTDNMGGHVDECKACGHQHYSYHSCKNRSCPQCYGTETKLWLEKRETELLPTRYFHLVFTLPSEMRDPVRKNQKLLYGNSGDTIELWGHHI